MNHAEVTLRAVLLFLAAVCLAWVVAVLAEWSGRLASSVKRGPVPQRYVHRYQVVATPGRASVRMEVRFQA